LDPLSTWNTKQRISNRRRPIYALAALAAVAVPIKLALPSTDSQSVRADDGRKRATATTGQVADLVRVVGGDHVNVTALMGPGVDPHLFKASERNVEDLIDSDEIFYNGLHLEGKLGEVLEQLAKRRPVTAVTDGIPLDLLTTPEGFDGNPDPHVWFDPTMWAYCADTAASALAIEDDANASTFLENAEMYKSQLADLHAYAQEQFARIPDQQRVLVTAHDAFGYLGRQYNIEVVGLQGISTSTEAGVRDVQRIADLLVERQVPTIFVETSVPRRTIEAVQVATSDRGWEVSIGEPLFSDALGDEGTPEGTYLGMFRYDVDTIVRGLQGVTEE
jgi:manganese/zinc/iron transport system substrate-binding protein